MLVCEMVQLREAEDAERVGVERDSPESAGTVPAHLPGCAKHASAYL